MWARILVAPSPSIIESLPEFPTTMAIISIKEVNQLKLGFPAKTTNILTENPMKQQMKTANIFAKRFAAA
jgi:hypothetical protein